MTLWALRCNLFLKPRGISPIISPRWKVNIHKTTMIMDPRDWKKKAYVFCPWPGRIGIWQKQNRKMTDLEAECRSVKCLWGIHSSILPVYSSKAVAASTGRQSLFIEEHCFSIPTAASDTATRFLSPRKAINSGRMVCNLQCTLFSEYGKIKHKRLLENNVW